MRWVVAYALLTVVTPRLVAQPETLVRLNISARDSHGKPVTNLDAADLRIVDEGKEQKALYFRRWGEGAATPAAAGAFAFRNRDARARHSIAIVLNLLDGAVQSQTVAEALAAMQQFGSRDDLYLYAIDGLSGALLPIRGLPEDGRPAEPAPASWPNAKGPRLKALVKPNANASGLTRRTDSAYSAMATLTAALAVLPGRKSVVWIGDQPLPARLQDWDTTDESRPMRDKMSRLLTGLESSDVGVYISRVTLAAPAAAGAHGLAPASKESQGPGLAAVTGGREYLDQVGTAIQDGVEETHGGYKVFYAPENAGAREYHAVKVTSDFRGINVNATQGYNWALARAGAQDLRETMERCVTQQHDANDIGLRLAVSAAADVRILHLRLNIDALDLLLLPDGGKFRAKLRVQMVDYGPDGRGLKANPRTIDLALTSEERAVAIRDGITLPVDVTVNASVRKFRAIVGDEATGMTGSVTATSSEWSRR